MSDPTAPNLSHLFTSLIGRSVTFSRIPPGPETPAKKVYGLYTHHPDGTAIVVKSDLLLLCSFAGALVGLPDSEVQSRLRAPVMDELLRDAVYEVLNVASSAVAAEGRAVLTKMVTNRSEIGDAFDTILTKPTHRIDFNVSIDDYEGGKFTVLS
jgi:hypothetical protein